MRARPAPVLFVAAELLIDCGEWSSSRGRWVTQPTARYDCHLCDTTEGPVTGEGPVKSFVEHVKTVHRGRCSAQMAGAR